MFENIQAIIIICLVLIPVFYGLYRWMLWMKPRPVLQKEVVWDVKEKKLALRLVMIQLCIGIILFISVLRFVDLHDSLYKKVFLIGFICLSVISLAHKFLLYRRLSDSPDAVKTEELREMLKTKSLFLSPSSSPLQIFVLAFLAFVGVFGLIMAVAYFKKY